MLQYDLWPTRGKVNISFSSKPGAAKISLNQNTWRAKGEPLIIILEKQPKNIKTEFIVTLLSAYLLRAHLLEIMMVTFNLVSAHLLVQPYLLFLAFLLPFGFGLCVW